jgi:tetraacyldisaccharide-1-P 4'-kinase
VTEKDAVKCLEWIDLPIWVVPSSVDIPSALLDQLTLSDEMRRR